MSNVIRLPQVPSLSWDDCKLLVESVEDYAIFMLDLNGRVATWNRGAQRLKGYTPDEIIGRSFSTFYVPDDVASGKPSRLLSTASDLGHVEDEGWRVRKDGTRFWASVVITALRDDHGGLRGFAKVTRDLTERRAVEEHLRRSEERLRLLIESVSDYAIYMLDASGHVTTWNVGAERIKGYSPDEIIGRHFEVFFPVEALRDGKPSQELETARRTGRFEEEGWRVRKDGSRFWANVVITSMRDAKGELAGFAKVTRDLTERRAAHEEMRRSEERLRLLVESVSDYAIYMLDPSGHVSSWNVGAQRIKGYAPNEIIGRHLSVFFPNDAVAQQKPQKELETARNDGRFEEEGWRVRKDGSRFWANVVITPIQDARGKLLGYAKVTRDLTQRQAAEEAQRKLEVERAAREAAEESHQRIQEAHALAEDAAREAEEASRMKDQFLSIVSHELRTPLNAMLGWASLLRSSQVDPRTQRGIDVIYRNAVAQGKLIDDMLDTARIVSGKIVLEPTAMDLVEVARDAMDAVAPSASAKKQHVALVSEPHSIAMVGDAVRVKQVVWNLLSNAVKFTPDGGSVQVRLVADAQSVSIAVQDNGSGIEPHFLPLLFEPFRQAETGSNRRSGGLGLGLSIVKHIVTLHGGEVRVESPETGGSLFVVTLPRGSDLTPTKAGERKPDVDPAVLRGKRMLVVDDSPDAIELMRDYLKSVGALVDSADSADAALASMRRHQPDILISDLGMPERDGYWLIQQVRALYGPGLPAVALSAYTQVADRARSAAAGFDGHLAKPVRVEELSELLAQLLTRRQRSS